MLDWIANIILILGLTGLHTASNTSLQRELESRPLWSGCRMHIEEGVPGDCWESLIKWAFIWQEQNGFNEPSHDSLSIRTICFIFRHVLTPGFMYEETCLWLAIHNIFFITSYIQERIWPTTMSSFLRESLHQKLTRGDCNELAELTLVLVAGGSETDSFVIKHTGALHGAKWMTRFLYSIKIILLSNNAGKNSLWRNMRPKPR